MENMEGRVWSLTEVGKYLGVDEMLSQIKEDEKEDLHTYLRRYFLNTHGMKQEVENQIWCWRMEGSQIGYKYLTALYENTFWELKEREYYGK